MSFVSRGFKGRRRPDAPSERIPPGQYATDDFPVLSAGPTPPVALEGWTFSIVGEVAEPRTWSWEEFRALPGEAITVDIHCVTKWSKLDTAWATSLPLEDLTDGKAWIAFRYDGEELDPEHGGPARLLVPHLYFWKSAKWVRGLRLTREDEPGFWESLGYHSYGDPWREQRYWGD
jgi:DMSO/TMAO reductase YedYZ molybdopterin-dependent catalytic subunit